MKKYLWFVFVCFCSFLSAQNTINQYQCVIVPSQFGFTTQTDQYRINTLTKLLLEKYGFKAYLDNEELPLEIRNSNCDKLYADVKRSGNFIITKMQLILKDCNHTVRYESSIGKSKEKEYGLAYSQALRDAFQIFGKLYIISTNPWELQKRQVLL